MVESRFVLEVEPSGLQMHQMCVWGWGGERKRKQGYLHKTSPLLPPYASVIEEREALAQEFQTPSHPPALTTLVQRGAEGQTCLAWGQPGLELSQLGGP